MSKPNNDLFQTSKKNWLKRERAWQQEMLTKSRVVATKNGLMEYAMIGDGPVVMAVHGMPGGFDQGIFGFDWIANAGFRLLAPSRP